MSSAVIGNLRVNLGLDTAQFSAGLKKAQGSLAGISSSFAGLARVAAAGAATALAGLSFSIWKSVQHMDELGKAAQKIGIPVSELSKLEYAAKLSDVSLDALTSTLARFSRNLVDVAAGGGGDAANALQQLKVSVTDAAGQIRPTSEIIADIAGRFATMKDGAEKTALAISLFGKSGAEMIPMLNGGSDAIRKAGAELERFGGVVTPEAARQAEEFNDNLTRLQTAFSGLLQEAIAPVLPRLIELTESLIELTKTTIPVGEWVNNVISFFAELKPFIETTRREIEAITEALRYLGLVAEKPIEINIPGGDLASGSGKGSLPAPLYDLVNRTQINDGVNRTESGTVPLVIEPIIKPGSTDDIYGAGSAVQSLSGDIQDANQYSEQLGTTLADRLSSGLADIATSAGSAGDAFTSLRETALSALQDIVSQIIRSGLTSLLSGIAGGAISGGSSFGGFYANGGTLGAGKWGIAGEKGPEIIHGPARVTPLADGRSGNVAVTVNNYSGQQVSTRETPDGRGGRRIEVSIGDMVAGELRRPGSAANMAVRQGFRSAPALTGR